MITYREQARYASVFSRCQTLHCLPIRPDISNYTAGMRVTHRRQAFEDKESFGEMSEQETGIRRSHARGRSVSGFDCFGNG